MILGIGKTVVQQQAIHAGEAFEIWRHLVMRYDVQELTALFHNFAHDADFKAFLVWRIDVLEKEVTKLENEMNKLGVPLPKRPPRSVNTPANTEIFRDETMLRSLQMMVQLFLNQLQKTVMITYDPPLRDMFIEMQTTEISLHAKLIAYGMSKGWLHYPPGYKA